MFFKEGVLDVFFFAILLFIYLIVKFFGMITNQRFFPTSLRTFLTKVVYGFYYSIVRMQHRESVSISRINLIDLALRNMTFKKSRSIITIGGMAVGIGVIVFLVSIGYGLQDLVIDRVARLDELHQINVSPQQGSKVRIDDETIATLNKFTEIESNLPVISLVGRVNYQNSVTDVAAYGVTTKYLTSSAVQPIEGVIFESDELAFVDKEVSKTEAVLGASLLPTRTLTRDDQIIAQVLGENSDSLATTTQEDAGATVELVDLAEGTESPEEQVEKVALGPNARREAVINRAMAKVLGITEAAAVGQTFEVSFVVVGNLLDNPSQKVESKPEKYTILGVVPDDKSPFFYVPFTDLRSLGITHFSQLKSIVKDESTLADVRTRVEALGFSTASVVDTLAQIDSLFNTARIVLGLIGMVAVSIASLGMFNTLTVSLMERTREVGFMKAMGMRSHEIKELFLTESLIMGIFGGVGGLLFGYLTGMLASGALTAYSLTHGGSAIDISSIPQPLIWAVLGLSLFVGITTGFYPARRATRISALNALRYE